MPDRLDGTLEERGSRTLLRFERRLRQPPERVWQALTDLHELRRWHPSPFELDARVGGAVRYLPPGGVAMGEGKVLEYDPPRVLAYTWGDDELRWEVRPDGDGSVLLLTHTFDDRFKGARDAAGWEVCLRRLEGALSGAELEGGEWAELNRRYQEKFGISPEQATPPPS